MKKIIGIFLLQTILACSQQSNSIEVEYLKGKQDFQITFTEDTYLKNYDSTEVVLIVSQKLALNNTKTSYYPREAMFSNDTLFGKSTNYGIGYAVLSFYNDKRVRLRDFNFKKKYNHNFNFKVFYRTNIPLSIKQLILNESIKKNNSEANTYLLKNYTENKDILNEIIPDTLKGYITFNIVNMKGEHQFYHYKKIIF